MFKKISMLLSGMFLLLSLAGCNSSKAYTYSVETGDSVKVSLDTSDKYDITSDLPFAISCDGTILSQGIFITSDNYSEYVDVVNADSNATLIDSGSKDGNKYIFWSYNNAEYNYAILIGDSNTGVILANNVSEEAAKECFGRITISIAK